VLRNIGCGLAAYQIKDLRPPIVTAYNLMEFEEGWWMLLDIDWLVNEHLLNSENKMYLSPYMLEVLRDERKTSAKFDPYRESIFSLGVVLLEMGSLANPAVLYSFRKLEINEPEIAKGLDTFSRNYSSRLYGTVKAMLSPDSANRPSPSELARYK
jgi:hypothetical protein